MPKPHLSDAYEPDRLGKILQRWETNFKAGHKRRELDVAPSLPLKLPKPKREAEKTAVVRTLRFVQLGCNAMVALLDQSLLHKRPDAYVRLSIWLCANILTNNRIRELSIGDIAQLSGLSRSTVSTTLTALENDGVIKRKRHSRGLQIYINPSVAWIGSQNDRTIAVDLWHNATSSLDWAEAS